MQKIGRYRNILAHLILWSCSDSSAFHSSVLGIHECWWNILPSQEKLNKRFKNLKNKVEILSFHLKWQKFETGLIFVWKSIALFIKLPPQEGAARAPRSTQSSGCQQWGHSSTCVCPYGQIITVSALGILSFTSHGEINPVLVREPGQGSCLSCCLPVFCQTRSAVPSYTGVSSSILQLHRHRPKAPFCQFILHVLDHHYIIQTYQHQVCRKHSFCSVACSIDHVRGQ